MKLRMAYDLSRIQFAVRFKRLESELEITRAHLRMAEYQMGLYTTVGSTGSRLDYICWRHLYRRYEVQQAKLEGRIAGYMRHPYYRNPRTKP